MFISRSCLVVAIGMLEVGSIILALSTLVENFVLEFGHINANWRALMRNPHVQILIDLRVGGWTNGVKHSSVNEILEMT